MLKMVLLLMFFHFFFFFSLGLAGTGQEYFNLLSLHDTTSKVLQASSHSGRPIAVSVSTEDLNDVSSSVLMAETWLRTHILSHYPAAQITTIVVGNTILCQKEQEQNLSLVLPSLKNIHHSLTRWGLEKDIKVSAAFSSGCSHSYSASYREEFAEKFIRPVLEFLKGTNSSYSVNPPPNFTPFPEEAMNLVFSHTECVKNLGFFQLDNKINVLLSSSPKERKPMSRKLSSLNPNMVVDPFPARPTPLPKTADSPLHSAIGYSVPANVAKHPHPPLSQIASPPQASQSPPLAQIVLPPPLSLPFAPESPFDPANPPFSFALPPCNPSYPVAPAPEIGVVQKLWCVAKPTVPADTLQEAMDYACGAGGADCDDIMPHGNCYSPDSVVAHASYAFNSYWQKSKRNGGSCSFGGTAMLINNDPSFLHCRFVLT